MTLQNLYIKLKKNKITKAQFLNEVRKDPYASKFVSPMNSFEDAVKILKSRDIISEVRSKSKTDQFDIRKYLKEVEDEVEASEESNDQEPIEKPTEETSLSADLEDATNRFIARLEQTPGYDEYENVVLMLEKIIKSMEKGKQTNIAILNSVKSKLL